MTAQHQVAILASLAEVDDLRRRRAADRSFDARLQALKRFQHDRFERTYSDLQTRADQALAARFFLDELYGPHDFSDRDAQFARIVPALVRLFPTEVVHTVQVLAELHALSERLDAAMCMHLPDVSFGIEAYIAAWRLVGEPPRRHQQIELMVQVGRSLIRFTRNPLLRQSLRLMRGPARAAGLATLQQFLERGFDTFRGLARPDDFLELIAGREHEIVAWLFGHPDACESVAAWF